MSKQERLSVQTIFNWLCVASFLWLILLSVQIGFISAVIFIGVALVASVIGAISVVFSFSSFVDYLANEIRSSGKLSDVIEPTFQYGKIGFLPNPQGLENSVNDFPLPSGKLRARFFIFGFLVWTILILYPSLYPQEAPKAINFWVEEIFDLPTLLWSFLTLFLSLIGSYVLAETYADNEVRQQLPDKLNKLFEKDFSTISLLYDEALTNLYETEQVLAQQIDELDYDERYATLQKLEQILDTDTIGYAVIRGDFDSAKETIQIVIEQLKFIQKPPTPEQAELDWAYEAVGLSPSATNDEIKKRRKELFKQYHPDLFQQHDKQAQLGVEEDFKKIKHAFDIIRDQARPN